MRSKLTIPLLTALLMTCSSVGSAALVSPNGIEILQFNPAVNGATGTLTNRGDQANVIDGNTGTASFLTPSGTTGPRIVAFDVGAATNLTRLRVAKSEFTDGTATPRETDLQILFSTDSGPLNERSYSPVAGLTNGFIGSELIMSAAVSPINPLDATVTQEIHNFADDGFFSLSFNSVAATSIAIQFAPSPGGAVFNHYQMFETELYDNFTQQTISAVDVFDTIAVPATPAFLGSNNRGDQNNAIDGNDASFGFLTPGGSVDPNMAVLDVESLGQIFRLRVKKDGNIDGLSSGAPGLAPIDNMDLQVLFTTDTGPLEGRNYQPVSGLASGFAGESINADSINPVDATIDNDHHDFALDGWYSLTFDPVNATSLALKFVRDGNDEVNFVHYPVSEFQVEAIPEPSSIILLGLGLLGIGFMTGKKLRT